MRKYRGRKHKRAMDTMKKYRIKGSVLYCNENNFNVRYFSAYEDKWRVGTISYF